VILLPPRIKCPTVASWVVVILIFFSSVFSPFLPPLKKGVFSSLPKEAKKPTPRLPSNKVDWYPPFYLTLFTRSFFFDKFLKPPGREALLSEGRDLSSFIWPWSVSASVSSDFNDTAVLICGWNRSPFFFPLYLSSNRFFFDYLPSPTVPILGSELAAFSSGPILTSSP